MNRSPRKPTHQILTETYRAQLKDLGGGLYFTEREHNYGSDRTVVETFGPNWILGFADLQTGQLDLRSGATSFQVVGPHAILVPPFSIIEWQLKAGEFKWWALSSDMPLPSELRTGPRVYSWNRGAFPQTPENVLAFLSASPICRIQEEKDRSQLAKKIKQHLYAHFKEGLNISELAKSLGISRVVFSRQFSKTYGISPIQYLNQMRIYEALRLMNSGHNITDSIMLCGYSSINQFIQFFKHHFSAVPRQYKMDRPPACEPLDLD